MHQDEMGRDLLVLLMKGLIYHSTVCVFFNLVSPKTLRMDLKLLLLYLPLLLFAVIRRMCGNFFAFLLLHILLSGIFILIFTDLEQRIVIGGCVCVMAISSLHTRVTVGNGREECPPLSTLAVFVIISLVAWQSARVQVMQISCYEALWFLVLFVIYRNINNFTEFLNENKTMENFPKDQMKAMNNLLLGVFVAFFIVGMLFLKKPSSYLFLTVGVICRELLRIVVKVLSWMFRNDVQQPEAFGQGAAQGSMPVLEAGETAALAELLEKFLVAAAGIGLAVTAIYLLVRFFYDMYQRFYEQHKEPDDESEFMWKKADQKEKIVKKHKQSALFQHRSPNQKIRRLYKKSIQSRFRSKERIPVEMTPMELELAEPAHLFSDKSNDELISEKYQTGSYADHRMQEDPMVKLKVALYEKARYSQHCCNKRDVEQMKQYMKSKQ